ncbi:hypothetical protein [Mesorhizobium sp.]|nr:hypothetical protein [Mesorhizobium sp.]
MTRKPPFSDDARLLGIRLVCGAHNPLLATAAAFIVVVLLLVLA